MGHLLFSVFHVVAVFYGLGLLLLTVPLHLIYAALRSRQQPATDGSDHVRCPECRELVRWDARKCKHCGAALTPPAAKPSPAFSNTESGGITIALATLAVIILVAKACSS